MPAPPEILQATGKVGLTEVEHEVETEQLRASPGDVAVAAEIAVDLPAESVNSDQQAEASVSEPPGKNVVGQQRAVIGDDALTEEAGEYQHQTAEEAFGIKPARLLYLRQQMGWALDRSRNQVGEEADEQGIVNQRAGRLLPAAVHVYDVGDCLKRIKRDPGRKNDLQKKR